MGQEASHILDAELDLSLDQIAHSPSLEPQLVLEHLTIREATASYQTTEQVTGPASDLDVTLKRAGEPAALVLSVTGRFQDKPLDMTLEGAPLPDLLDGVEDYPLQAQAQSAQLTAWADTRLGAILSPGNFTGKLVLKGTDGRDREQWVGPVLPPLPGYRLSGRVSRDNQRWSVTSLDGTIGDTELTGEVHFTNADQPDIPLSNVVIDFTLNEGLAVLDPVRFGVGDGHVDFSLDLDTKPDPPEGTLQLEVKAVNHSKALREWSIGEGTVGTVGGQEDRILLEGFVEKATQRQRTEDLVREHSDIGQVTNRIEVNNLFRLVQPGRIADPLW